MCIVGGSSYFDASGDWKRVCCGDGIGGELSTFNGTLIGLVWVGSSIKYRVTEQVT